MQFTMSRHNMRAKYTAMYVERMLNEGPTAFPVWHGEHQEERRKNYL
jgi:hypothetical protein